MDGISPRISQDPARDVTLKVALNRGDHADAATDSPASAPSGDIFKSVPPEPKTVKMSWIPQDPGILPVEKAEVDATDLKDGIAGPRVRISEPRDYPVPHPDKDGNYLFGLDDPRFDATQTYVTTTRTLQMAEKYLGRDLPWGFSQELGRDQMIIRPHAGSGVANAFYNSQAGSLNFFSFTDPKTGEILRSGQSGDVVAHETGHAVLDGIRHGYISSLAVGAGGYHESFSDCTAMLSALQSDSVLDRMREETGGDLRKPNVVSRMAESLGVGISHIYGGAATDSLRSALNNYKLADQHFYPYTDRQNPNNGMGQESHAYSNIFTGTFYEIFNGLYQEAARDSSRTFKAAAGEARDTAGRLLFRGAEFAPAADPSYKDVALAILQADQLDNAGSHRPLLEKVFKDRRILNSDDIAAFNTRQESLPAITFDAKATASGEAAMAFLDAHREALGLSKEIPLEFVESHGNKRGETFMVYSFSQDFDLQGPDFGTLEGSKARASGGVVLAFDREGKLICNNFQDVTDRKMDDIRDHLKTAVANKAISVAGSQASQAEVMSQDGVVYLQLTQGGPGEGSVIQRSPVIWG